MTMHRLGNTRSANRRDHLLQTPDAFVRIPLPCLRDALAVVHIGAARDAKFAQMTVEFDPGGVLSSVGLQRFVYVLDGHLSLRCDRDSTSFTAGSFAYVPGSVTHHLLASGQARVVVIERPTTLGVAPPWSRDLALVGKEEECAAAPLMGDEDVQVRTLLPAEFECDFAVNTMTYEPGAALPMAEVHVMEHGLLMLEGGGIYRLGNAWYPVQAGDFIWMGPFCPQWFGAIGKTPAKYLIYKDWNQHPLRRAR